jgi:hypothetical protein
MLVLSMIEPMVAPALSAQMEQKDGAPVRDRAISSEAVFSQNDLILGASAG